ncbi:MAG: 4Fe-4S binding protein [Vicinamibacterales bacterium]
MRIGAMLGDITRSLFKRPFTERYPFERYPAPERLRGMVVWDPEKCTGCKICVRDCPANALELIVLDKAAKRYVLRVHNDRCTFCAQCVASCNFDCISLSPTAWELASLSRKPFVVSYGRKEDLGAAKP